MEVAGEQRGVVDLRSAQAVYQSRVEVARGLPAANHELTLTVLDGQATIDGFVVPVEDNDSIPVLALALCLLGLVVSSRLLCQTVSRITHSLRFTSP